MGSADFVLRLIDGVNRITKGGVRRQVERERYDWKLALVIHRQRRRFLLKPRECAKRHLSFHSTTAHKWI